MKPKPLYLILISPPTASSVLYAPLYTDDIEHVKTILKDGGHRVFKLSVLDEIISIKELAVGAIVNGVSLE